MALWQHAENKQGRGFRNAMQSCYSHTSWHLETETPLNEGRNFSRKRKSMMLNKEMHQEIQRIILCNRRLQQEVLKCNPKINSVLWAGLLWINTHTLNVFTSFVFCNKVMIFSFLGKIAYGQLVRWQNCLWQSSLWQRRSRLKYRALEIPAFLCARHLPHITSQPGLSCRPVSRSTMCWREWRVNLKPPSSPPKDILGFLRGIPGKTLADQWFQSFRILEWRAQPMLSSSGLTQCLLSSSASIISLFFFFFTPNPFMAVNPGDTSSHHTSVSF